jgi:hypothetical protein
MTLFSQGNLAASVADALRRCGHRDRVEEESQRMTEAGGMEPRLHTPEEIATMLGGISVKTLNDLVRDRGHETTTVGYAPPSRKGGPKRRIWGMTDQQLEALLAARRRRGRREDAAP